MFGDLWNGFSICLLKWIDGYELLCSELKFDAELSWKGNTSWVDVWNSGRIDFGPQIFPKAALYRWTIW